MVKVTKKYQITIPEDVRKKIGLRPDEEVEVIALNDNEILIRRKVRRIKDPLSILFGPQSDVEIPPEKVDELGEE